MLPLAALAGSLMAAENSSCAKVVAPCVGGTLSKAKGANQDLVQQGVKVMLRPSCGSQPWFAMALRPGQGRTSYILYKMKVGIFETQILGGDGRGVRYNTGLVELATARWRGVILWRERLRNCLGRLHAESEAQCQGKGGGSQEDHSFFYKKNEISRLFNTVLFVSKKKKRLNETLETWILRVSYNSLSNKLPNRPVCNPGEDRIQRTDSNVNLTPPSYTALVYNASSCG